MNHGERGCLERVQADDTLVYSSPGMEQDATVSLPAFTALGRVVDDDFWPVDESDFGPYRRRVRYAHTLPVPSGGYQLRCRLVCLNGNGTVVLRDSMKP